jgi:hypothetical protein
VAAGPAAEGSARSGGRVELALASGRIRVPSDTAPDLMPIGSATRVLGVADTRILTFDDRYQTCVDRGCPITVRTVTRDGC